MLVTSRSSTDIQTDFSIPSLPL
nr:unnamed protein product [Callosobruchus chinensis]